MEEYGISTSDPVVIYPDDPVNSDWIVNITTEIDGDYIGILLLDVVFVDETDILHLDYRCNIKPNLIINTYLYNWVNEKIRKGTET